MESSNWNDSNRYQPTLQIPQSLLGRNITVYRGGPESKTGKLLDIKEDCVVIYADNKTIYYRTEHIKSITEDLKANAIPSNNSQTDPFFYHEDDFLSLLSNFLNKKIQVDQGGPDSKQGILLVIGSDYLVLSTEDDGIVYYNLHHIKSIMGLEEDLNNIEEDTEESSSNWVMEESSEEMMMSNIHRGSDFHHLCSLMSHKWVSINRKGPEALEGIFVDSSDGFFTLANNQELYRIHPFHVRNISIGPKGAMNQQQNNNQQEDQTEDILDESTSEYTITSSHRTDAGDRESSRERNTSRRRSSNGYRTDVRWRTSRNRRTSSRNRRTSSSRHRHTSTSRRRRSSGRWNRSSSSYYRTGRNETVVRSVDFDWKPNS